MALAKRNMYVWSTICDAREEALESTDHLLILCKFVKKTWSLIKSWCRMKITNNDSALERLKVNTWIHGSKDYKKLALCIILFTIWFTWKARNDKVFNKRNTKHEHLREEIKSATTSTSQKEDHHSVTNLKTGNFDKVTVEVAKEHMGLLSTLVSSYNGLLAGQIRNPHLTNEDYSQIDPDDMERIDIMWALASADDEGENWDFRFNSEKGGEDKACVAEIKKAVESIDESNSEETKTGLDESSGS
ncbi:hypothetical protein R6Q59_033292 [Mikania micrantha]